MTNLNEIKTGMTESAKAINQNFKDLKAGVEPIKLWQPQAGAGMNANQTAKPSKRLTQCANGWVFEWKEYRSDGTVVNSGLNYVYVPKQHAVFNNGYGVVMNLNDYYQAHPWSKYLYISDDIVTGHDNNWRAEDGYGEGSKHWVLTAIYEY